MTVLRSGLLGRRKRNRTQGEVYDGGLVLYNGIDCIVSKLLGSDTRIRTGQCHVRAWLYRPAPASIPSLVILVGMVAMMNVYSFHSRDDVELWIAEGVCTSE